MKIKSSFSVIAAVCCTLGIARAQTTLTNGLVAYWPFDVINGSTTPDLALGNNMTVVGPPALVAGERTNCFQFSSSSQYVYVAHTTNFEATGLPIYTTNGYTVALWLKGAPQTANHIPFSDINFNNSGLLFDLNTAGTANGKIRVFVRDNAGASPVNNVSSAGTVFDSTWHHVAWEDYNGVCKLYIDGNLDTQNFNYTAASAGPPTGTMTAVGALYRTGTIADAFTGSVDEIMAWNRILTQAEIQNAMSNGIPEPILPTPPTFITQPASSTNAMGDMPTLSANVFGNQPMTYQWYSNNIILPGQTASSLVLTTLDAPATTTYSLVASNSVGTNISNPAILVVLPDAPATNIDSGLVGYWPFNTLSNSATSTPDLVSQNNFQLTNMSGANLVPGKFGNALSFDGATQYGIETTGTPIYNVSTTYSVAFWVNGPGSQSGYRIIFANGNPANGDYFLIGDDPSGTSGKLDVRINPGTGGDVLSTATALDGTWHHVAWVDQNGVGLLYIDGVLDQTVYNYTRSSFTLSNTTVAALVDTNFVQYYFAGDLNQLGTWNRRLSYTEIQSIVANGVPTPPTIVKPTVGTPATSEASVYQGDSITISAATSGTSPGYQWYFNNSKISGAGNPSALTPTLSLSSVQTNQSGTYSLVASNASGAASNSIVLTVIPYTPVTSGTALQVEFNYSSGPVVQSGFSSMTVAGNPATFGGPSITLSPIGSTALGERARGNIVSNNPPTFTTADLYEQIIFSTANTPNTGIDAFITRLAPNTPYGITIWSYDQQNAGISDWTATGSGPSVTMTYPNQAPYYYFSGQTLPSYNYADTMGALATSSASGTLDIQGIVDPATSGITVFLNALVLVANPIIKIISAQVASDGNLQLIVSTQYALEPITFLESSNLQPGSWQPAGDMVSMTTAGPVVTAEFPLSSTQNYYQAVFVP